MPVMAHRIYSPGCLPDIQEKQVRSVAAKQRVETASLTAKRVMKRCQEELVRWSFNAGRV